MITQLNHLGNLIQVSSAPYRVYNIGNNAPVQLLEKSIGIEAKKNMMDIQPGDVVSTYADFNLDDK